MWFDSYCTASEKRGLLLLVLVLSVIVSLVWLFSGNTRQDATEVMSGPHEKPLMTDSVTSVGHSVLSSDVKNKPKRSKKRKNKESESIAPRRSPLDEPVPHTR